MSDTLICPFCGNNRVLKSGERTWRCPSCHTSFSEEDEALLAESFRSLTLDIRKLGEENIRIILSSGKNGEEKLFRAFRGSSAPRGGAVGEDEWKRIAQTLFCACHFERWKETYFDQSIVDGMMWTISVSFCHKHSLSAHGCNGYPPYWNSVIETLSFCFTAMGLETSDFLSKRKEPS